VTIVLGIDLATADVRVQAFDVETGETILERRRTLEVTGSGGMRTQPARHGEWARELVKEVAGRLGPRAREIRALCITGTSGTVVPVDAAGAPVGDAVLYDDPRGLAQLRALAEAGLDRRPSVALARAAWMHAESPASRYVFTPDVVVAILAGRLLPSDTSHALKSGIDPVAGKWDLEALATVNLPPESMPDLVAPGQVIGEVAHPSALGLPDGVLIVSGMTDGSTGQIATGAVVEGDTVGVLGTTLVLKAVSRRDVVDGAAGIYSHVAPDGLFWPGGASNTGAGVLRTGPTAALDPAAHAAEIAAFGSADSVSYPLARPGERFPVVSADFTGFSVAIDGTDRADAEPIARLRAVYEGVAFVERLGLERLSALGVERGPHYLAGGTATSEVWNRIRATVLGRPVIVSAGAGSARGAAVIAAWAIGSEPLSVVARRFSSARLTVDPASALIEAMEERYRVFLDTLNSRTSSRSNYSSEK
jgi:sugar (pentulose or hexulose) kinase